jgi:tripartite-type tricarboxylate transporter receptor subunit TctC
MNIVYRENASYEAAPQIPPLHHAMGSAPMKPLSYSRGRRTAHHWLGVGLAVAGALLSAGPVKAQPTAFPAAGPIKLVVPFAPGGATDAVARLVAASLARRLNQQVMVENRGGAGGSIGALAVVNSPGDGHTLLLGSNGTMVLSPLLHATLKYNVERDLLPVAGIVALPYLLVSPPAFAARDIKGLVDMARSQPGTLTYASPGNGTTNHLVGVLIESMTRSDMRHVPYRGAALAMNDVISGQVNFMSGDLGTLMPMVKAGKLKALAVTGRQRLASLPDVPTVAEALPGFEALGWFGIFAPRATPAAVADRLAAEITQVLAEVGVRQRLEELGGQPLLATGEQLRSLITQESAKWKKLITDHKVSAEDLK